MLVIRTPKAGLAETPLLMWNQDVPSDRLHHAMFNAGSPASGKPCELKSLAMALASYIIFKAQISRKPETN